MNTGDDIAVSSTAMSRHLPVGAPTSPDNGWSFHQKCSCGHVASRLTIADATAAFAVHREALALSTAFALPPMLMSDGPEDAAERGLAFCDHYGIDPILLNDGGAADRPGTPRYGTVYGLLGAIREWLRRIWPL